MGLESARDATKIRGERWGHFVICDRTTGAVVGAVSVARKGGRWELSYQLAKALWGTGIPRLGGLVDSELWTAQIRAVSASSSTGVVPASRHGVSVGIVRPGDLARFMSAVTRVAPSSSARTT